MRSGPEKVIRHVSVLYSALLLPEMFLPDMRESGLEKLMHSVSALYTALLLPAMFFCRIAGRGEAGGGGEGEDWVRGS